MAKLPTDANDLHVLAGLDVLRSQLLAAMAQRPLSKVETAPPAAAADFNSDPSAPPDSAPPLEAYAEDVDSPRPLEGRALEIGESFEETEEQNIGQYDVGTLLDKFWLVYGSDTVWDDINRLQMRLSHLRHAILKDKFNVWQESPRRRIVRDIRFEPGIDLGRVSVNLYNGFSMQPGSAGADGCRLIRNHIWRLCGQREDEFWWLLNWIAYPLQKPGKKMASSVIMYGSEGPGKSIIWELVVKRIYGEYGVTIGQAQLDSQFTGWQSKRLFAVAEEVVSRSERSHHKGALKHLVTGETLRVNEKNLPEHEESNHLNFVFLSNSTVPLELDFGDRRYLVLYCDEVPDAQYFIDLIAEIEGGGVECFYRYLLDLDTSQFNAHTKPPLNEEKRNLISASLPAPLYFLQEWQAENLEFPYGAAQVSDLWLAFQRWSESSNEFKRKRRDFEAEIRRRCKYERTMLDYPSISTHQTTRFWVPPDAIPADADRNEYLRLAGDQCRRFSASLGAARTQQGCGDD